jgi:hypothetical protein
MNQMIARTRPQSKSTSIRARRVRRAVCEALEERQLMALTITLRETGGASSAVVTQVGQVINLEVLATVTSANNIPSQDGVQDVDGNFESSAVDGHAVAGNLSAANISPFNAVGSSPGTDQALTSDGNIDVGSKFQSVVSDGSTSIDTTGQFSARSGSPTGLSDGMAVDNGTALQLEIATVTYTVTSLGEGGTTDINFIPTSQFVPNLPEAADWIEGGVVYDNIDAPETGAPATFQAGTPFTVNDPSLIVAPTAVADSATVTKNTATTINVLSNDQVIVPLNDSSVTITSTPSHGTAIPNTNGTVLYTPTNGYLGSDSFSYTVADQDGRVSNAATVSITVVPPPPPVAGDVSSTTVRGTSDTISVLGSDTTTSPAVLVPTSVTVTTAPAHGTAVVQTNGSIIYTPAAGYTGSDTFQYTVSDSNSETSAPGTVSITVNEPTPPVANGDTASTTEGAPVTISVLTNDTAPSATLNPASITITTAAAHGTAVPQSDGTVLYTPTPGYTGTDTFQYTVDDTLSDASNPAAVTITIAAGVAPTANTVTAPAVSGSTSSINVLSNASGGAPLVPSSVTVSTQPTDGTATVNSSTGIISYVPKAGFVGTDTFMYTVADVNGLTSAPAAVSVNVGTDISSTKGAAHSLTFTDALNGVQTISLKAGSAAVFFNGSSGTVTVARNGKATVSGSGLQISGITLTGTTKASALSIKGSVKDPVTVDGITDTGPLGSISAPSAVLSGALQLYSDGSLTAASLSAATITIGAGLPGHFSLVAGAVNDSTLTSAVPITLLKTASWTDNAVGSVAASSAIQAPSIGRLIDAGAFNATVNLTASGKAPTLASASIAGALDGNTWTVAGTTGSVVLGSATPATSAVAWNGSFGTIGALTVRSGGFGGTLSTGSIRSLTINGNLTGTVTATSAASVRVAGDFNGATFTVNGLLGRLLVTGTIGGSALTTTGGITSITAGSINTSQILVGAASGVTSLPVSSASDVGTATIGSIKLTGRSGDQYTNSDIITGTIKSASLGTVAINNNGTGFGLAVGTITSFTGIFNGNPLRANRTDLANNTVLASVLTSQGVTFGDFEIQIEG